MNTALSSAEQGEKAASPVLRLFGVILKLVGVTLWGCYLVYLPMPELFQFPTPLKLAGVTEPGMVFYSLATAGAAIFVWGKLMGELDDQVISRRSLLRASAIGMLMWSLMRLGTTLFPHGPFEQMLALPMAEFITFAVIALLLHRAGS